jgi:hypothetical protein
MLLVHWSWWMVLAAESDDIDAENVIIIMQLVQQECFIVTK